MIKVVVNAVSAKSGGAETYIRNLTHDLSKLGHSNHYILYVPQGKVSNICSLENNVEVRETGIGLTSIWKRFLWDQVLLRKVIKQEQVEILISSSDFGMLFPPCSQLLILRNSLFFSESYANRFLNRKSMLFRMKFLLKKWLVVLSVRFSDVVMTASKSMHDELHQLIGIFDNKAVVNYFGVPLERFKEKGVEYLSSRKGPLRVLYVSEYSDYKNLTTLLKAVLSLREKGMDDFYLTTTAHPEQFPDVEIISREIDKALASHPLVSSSVNFTGPIPYDEIQKLYQESDIFVFPSLAESFGHPLVEAMASGLPIIASDIPICREICDEAAVYFSPLDPQDLADKIIMLRNNPKLRQQLGKIGTRRAKVHFDWKDHVRRLIDIIEQVPYKKLS